MQRSSRRGPRPNGAGRWTSPNLPAAQRHALAWTAWPPRSNGSSSSSAAKHGDLPPQRLSRRHVTASPFRRNTCSPSSRAPKSAPCAVVKKSPNGQVLPHACGAVSWQAQNSSRSQGKRRRLRRRRHLRAESMNGSGSHRACQHRIDPSGESLPTELNGGQHEKTRVTANTRDRVHRPPKRPPSSGTPDPTFPRTSRNWQSVRCGRLPSLSYEAFSSRTDLAVVTKRSPNGQVPTNAFSLPLMAGSNSC
jgi:hypothetical protein